MEIPRESKQIIDAIKKSIQAALPEGSIASELGGTIDMTYSLGYEDGALTQIKEVEREIDDIKLGVLRYPVTNIEG